MTYRGFVCACMLYTLANQRSPDVLLKRSLQTQNRFTEHVHEKVSFVLQNDYLWNVAILYGILILDHSILH